MFLKKWPLSGIEQMGSCPFNCNFTEGENGTKEVASEQKSRWDPAPLIETFTKCKNGTKEVASERRADGILPL
jgi:hypothetical protein